MASESATAADRVSAIPAARYYPGWTMLAIAGAAQFMSAPGQSYSVAAFKDPMRDGLALSERDYSLAYGFATIVSACLLPLVGRLVDRFGARVMLPLIACGLGAACLLMSRVESLVGLYLGFAFVRSLGQGALSLVSVWLVGEWFARKRAMATAIAGLGGGFSVMTVPLINNWIIERYGWESGWVALALAVWAVLVLPGILLVRDRPEDIGLTPDGFDAEQPASEAEPARSLWRRATIAPTEESWTVPEVLRNATFWKLLSVPGTAGLVGTGLIFHQVKLLGQHGLSPTAALAMMTVQAVFATIMTFPIGWATDRIPNRFILSAAMLMLASAVILMLTMPAAWLAVVYALVLGLHGSILRSTASVVWINYFGRANQGAVRGVAWSVMILASALGPLPLAESIDRYGSYTPALLAFLALPLFAAIAVFTAHAPRRPVD